jgi:outer membrane protein OmpA-like peptidoglycan-associated protein
MLSRIGLLTISITLVGTAATFAQTTRPPAAPAISSAPATAASPSAPDSLFVFFGSGSATVTPQGDAVLDQAARTYRDGKPIIMVVSGGSDSTGSAAANLHLSQVRADNVLKGLVARGIPIERFQVLAKGETEPNVAAPEGTPEARNRSVQISWR